MTKYAFAMTRLAVSRLRRLHSNNRRRSDWRRLFTLEQSPRREAAGTGHANLDEGIRQQADAITRRRCTFAFCRLAPPNGDRAFVASDRKELRNVYGEILPGEISAPRFHDRRRTPDPHIQPAPVVSLRGFDGEHVLLAQFVDQM